MKKTLLACSLWAFGCAGGADRGGEPKPAPQPIAKPAAQQRAAATEKPGAPVEVTAEMGDSTARIQIRFTAGATAVRVELEGTDGLLIAGDVIPIDGRAVGRGEALVLDVAFTTSQPHSNLAVIVSGSFGGRAMSRAASFTIGEPLPQRVRAQSAGPTLDGVKIAGEAETR